MSDREIVFSVVVLVVGYYYFVLRRHRGVTKNLQGRATTGRSGTVAGGASKMPTTHRNTNARTNAQQGRGNGFIAAPIAQVGSQTPAPSGGNVGTLSKSARRMQSSATSGLVGSFVSGTWPTRRVTSTGSQVISAGKTQVPSYAAVPQTVQGPGGGGALLH